MRARRGIRSGITAPKNVSGRYLKDVGCLTGEDEEESEPTEFE